MNTIINALRKAGLSVTTSINCLGRETAIVKRTPTSRHSVEVCGRHTCETFSFLQTHTSVSEVVAELNRQYYSKADTAKRRAAEQAFWDNYNRSF